MSQLCQLILHLRCFGKMSHTTVRSCAESCSSLMTQHLASLVFHFSGSFTWFLLIMLEKGQRQHVIIPHVLSTDVHNPDHLSYPFILWYPAALIFWEPLSVMTSDTCLRVPLVIALHWEHREMGWLWDLVSVSLRPAAEQETKGGLSFL